MMYVWLSLLMNPEYSFMDTYFALPLRRFSRSAGGGDRTVCECGMGELDTVAAIGTITAAFDESRSDTKGRFIFLSTILYFEYFFFIFYWSKYSLPLFKFGIKLFIAFEQQHICNA